MLYRRRLSAHVLTDFELHPYVIMPNHVHLLVSLRVPLPHLAKSLKGITAKRGNTMLVLTASPSGRRRATPQGAAPVQILRGFGIYIDENPVHAGLASLASDIS